jgi:exodeoxyribonuclease VII small subunit
VPKTPPDETPGYEQARDELADVVRQLEAGGVTLEESLRLWERGEYLASVCEEWLDGAKARLDAARAARRSEDAETPTGGSAGGSASAQ